MSRFLLMGVPGSGGGAAPSWSPSDFGASLVGWWKADAGTNEDVDGVYQWDDQSGNARHLVQATGAKKPDLLAAQQNGLPGIDFDVTDDALAVSFGSDQAQPNTIFAAYKFQGITGNRYLFDGVTSGKRHVFYIISGTHYWFYGGASTQLSTPPDTSPHVLTLVVNGASSKYREDGADVVSSFSSGAEPLSGLTLNAYITQAANIGEIMAFELFIVNKAASAEEITSAETYLNDRWAIY